MTGHGPALLAGIAALGSGPAAAAPPDDGPDRFVCVGGSENEDCCPTASSRCHGSLAEAVAAASDGEWIEIGAGVYDGPTVIRGLRLTITGKRERLPPILTTSDRASSSVVTVYDGGEATLHNVIFASPLARAVDVGPDSAVVIEESFLSASAPYTFGGVARVQPGARLEIRDAVVSGGIAASFGGQVYAEEADVVLERCTLAGGVAHVGGGAVAVRTAGSLTATDVVVEGATTYGSGGAVWIDGDVRATLTGGVLAGNQASDSGGALAVRTGGAAVLTDTTVTDNVAGRTGGGIVADASGSLTLVRTRLERNRALGGGGGAVHWRGDAGPVDATWTNVWFVENTSRGDGGAVLLAVPGTVRILRGALLGNDAGDEGGAVAVAGLDRLELLDGVVAWTRAGGAVVHDGGLELACSGLWYANAGGHVVPSAADCLGAPGNLVDVDPRVYAYSADANGLNDDLGYNPRASPLAGAGVLDGADRDGSPPDLGPAAGPEAAAADWEDQDGDGWADVHDCNDADHAIHPGREVDAADGLDRNCDGSDRVDLDRDGVSPPADCDDEDPRVSPLAEEDADLAVDRDCDGFVAPTHPVRPVGCAAGGGGGLLAALLVASSALRTQIRSDVNASAGRRSGPT